MAESPFAIATTRIEWEDQLAAQKRHIVELDVPSTPKADMTDRVVSKPLIDRGKSRIGALWAEIEFTTEFAGSGVVGTPPGNHKLLECCGMEVVTVTSTSVTYGLDYTLRGSWDDGAAGGDTDDQVDITVAIDNLYKQVVGNARGNSQFVLEQGEEGKVIHTMIGNYTEPDEAALSAALAVSADAPVCKGLTVTIGGQNMDGLKRVIIDLGCFVPPRKGITGTNGTHDPVVRDQNVTFVCEFEHPDKSTLNIWNLFTTETKIALHAVLGTTAGNIITIDVEGHMNDVPAHTETDQSLMTTIGCDESMASGDTQLTIVYT